MRWRSSSAAARPAAHFPLSSHRSHRFHTHLGRRIALFRARCTIARRAIFYNIVSRASRAPQTNAARSDADAFQPVVRSEINYSVTNARSQRAAGASRCSLERKIGGQPRTLAPSDTRGRCPIGTIERGDDECEKSSSMFDCGRGNRLATFCLLFSSCI